MKTSLSLLSQGKPLRDLLVQDLHGYRAMCLPWELDATCLQPTTSWGALCVVYVGPGTRRNTSNKLAAPLQELDAMDPKARLTSLIQGALAGNIFDWGARATVDLYHDGTILEIYR